MYTNRAPFTKIRALFSIVKIGQARPPPFPPLVAHRVFSTEFNIFTTHYLTTESKKNQLIIELSKKYILFARLFNLRQTINYSLENSNNEKCHSKCLVFWWRKNLPSNCYSTSSAFPKLCLLI